jgi:hypothetical protein
MNGQYLKDMIDVAMRHAPRRDVNPSIHMVVRAPKTKIYIYICIYNADTYMYVHIM